MYEYIKGALMELSPTYVIVDCNNIGYFVNISLHTYSLLEGKKEDLVYIHQVIREDSNILYGFKEKKEREMFRSLISVSGVGPNTARMMLSSLSPNELHQAILSENVQVLKGVKGIGAKSAQRIILDLKDKLDTIGEGEQILLTKDNTIRDEALSALVMLGFQRNSVLKVINGILKENSTVLLEDLIKQALKKL